MEQGYFAASVACRSSPTLSLTKKWGRALRPPGVDFAGGGARSMSSTLVEELSRRAQELTPDERVQLAEEILATIHSEDEEVDAAWDAEIKRRIAEIENGTAELIPAEEVFARLRRLST